MPTETRIATEPAGSRSARVSALDRLVLAELLLLDRPRRTTPRAPEPEPETETEPEPELEATDAPLGQDEEAFVARTAAWLAGRPNADMLIDAIWSRAQSGPQQPAPPASAPAGPPAEPPP